MAQADTAPVDYSDRWEKMWRKGLKPGEAFDAEDSSPALIHLLQTSFTVKDQYCFVPGCGRGYDLITLLNHGAKSVIGLELAPSSIPACQQYLDTHLTEDASRAGDAVQIIQGDFYKWREPTGNCFDIGYDYTFMCAMHPSMRQDWAKTWYDHLKPGGRLITLIFPIEEEGRQGPPWPVNAEIYKDVLVAAGFTLSSMEEVPSERSHVNRGGREALAVWQKSPTVDGS